MDIQKINTSIDGIISNLLELKVALSSNFQPEVAPPKINLEAQSTPIIQEEFNDFESLRKALLSDRWPEAVNANLICSPNNEEEKMERGRGIVELMIEEHLKDLKFLDMGCGEGQTVFVSTDYNTKLSAGYDIKHQSKWEQYKKDNVVFSTNFQEISAHAPYDVILIFDVLDHLVEESQISFLQKAKSVLNDEGKIYMRCHPFCSRHATHLYHDLNKAYLHLIFTEEELKQIIPDPKYYEANNRVLFPGNSYSSFIEQAGLRIETRRDITEKVESFFKIPKIAERIMKNNGYTKFPDFQLGLQFLDYVLKKN